MNRALSVLLFLVMALSVRAADIVITNNSFELPVQTFTGPNGGSWASVAPNSWIATNSVIVSTASNTWIAASVTIPDGVQAVGLQNSGTAGVTSSITCYFTAGTSTNYQLRFFAAYRTFYQDDGLIFSIDGTPVATYADGIFTNVAFLEYTNSDIFIAAGLHTLTIQENPSTPTSDKAIFIDKVQLLDESLFPKPIPPGSLGVTNLNLAAYGATGDAQLLFQVNVTSNSPLVTCTGTNRFTSAAIGEVIELFYVHSQLGIGVTNEDIADLITNVTSGTNLYLSIVPTYTTNTVCTVGKNNATNIQWCINDATALIAGGYSNVTIGIPNGNYLVIGTNAISTTRAYGTAVSALDLQTGGVTFQATNASWVGLGAGVTHADGPNNYVDRDTTLTIISPTAYYNYPIVFSGLAFDGGVQNGAQAYQYFPPRTGDGVGWDTTDHGVVFYDQGYPGQPTTQGFAQGPKLTLFTNCTFHSWRGEMVIGSGDTGGTNAFIDYANCGFYDGNASAINSDFSHHVHSCQFNNVNKVAEWYESRATLPSTWEFNTWSNVYNNECFTVVGAIKGQVQQPLTFQSNVCWATFGNENLDFSPAENVTIVGNTLITSNGGPNIALDSSAVQPANGTAAWNSNFFIAFNTFKGGGFNGSLSMINFLVVSNHNFGASVNGGGWGAIDNASIYKYGSEQDIFTNNVFMFNDGTNGGFLDDVAIGTNGQYWIDISNNFAGWWGDNNWGGPTNVLSYGFGSVHNFTSGAALTPNWYVDDTAGARIPAGATLLVNNASGANIPIYLDAAMTRPLTLTNNVSTQLDWNGTAWEPFVQPIPFHQHFFFLKLK